MIIARSQYGYEVKTSDGRYYSLLRNGSKFSVNRIRAGNDYQLFGSLVHGIPNEIKTICFNLQKNENRD